MLDGLYAALCKGDVGLSGLELHDAADVAGGDGGNLFLLGACYGVNGAEALTVAGFGVHEVCALIEGAAHYLEVGNFTEVLLYAGLEDEQGNGTCGVAFDCAAVHCGLFLAFR